MELLAELVPDRGRHSRVQADVGAVLALLERDLGATPLGAGRVALEAADGRNVVVDVEPGRVGVRGRRQDPRWFDEEHGRWEEEPAPDGPLEDVLDRVLPVLHDALGWKMSVDGVPWKPEGRCPSCRRPFFGWHVTCVGCGGDLVRGGPRRSTFQKKADAFLAALDAEDLVEWEDGADRTALHERLATYWKRGGREVDVMLGMFERSDQVADVFGTERQWAAVVKTLRLPR